MRKQKSILGLDKRVDKELDDCDDELDIDEVNDWINISKGNGFFAMEGRMYN